MYAMQTRISTNVTLRPHAVSARRAGQVTPRRPQLTTNAENEGKTKGVIPGLNQWPPKSFTEHGEPKPEDDPKNYDVVTGKRTGGPSESELEKKKEERNKDRPFSNPDRQGGTQRGGGGEGMSS